MIILFHSTFYRTPSLNNIFRIYLNLYSISLYCLKLKVGVITDIDEKFPVFNPGLPRKPLISLILGQARRKLILDADLKEIAMHRYDAYFL